MGVHHGLFDTKIREYSRNLNYDKETKCRVCSVEFKTGLAKATTMKKHYAEHFGKAMRKDIQGWNEGTFLLNNIRVGESIRKAFFIHVELYANYYDI